MGLELIGRAVGAERTRLVGPVTGTELDDADEYDSGWFCIRTDPFPCPAEGCGFVATFQTAVHLVVVWPSSDDRDLLTTARNCQVAGRNPRIVEYEPDFGKAVSWDAWDRAGRPIHGRMERPEGWDKLSRL
jgi:hypothetical protein